MQGGDKVHHPPTKGMQLMRCTRPSGEDAAGRLCQDLARGTRDRPSIDTDFLRLGRHWHLMRDVPVHGSCDRVDSAQAQEKRMNGLILVHDAGRKYNGNGWRWRIGQIEKIERPERSAMNQGDEEILTRLLEGLAI